MSAKLEELTAQFAGERMRWDETILGTVQLPIVAGEPGDAIFDPPAITIKGPADPDELQYGVSYRFYGKWETYKNQRTGQDERQFHFSTFARVQPHNRGGVIRYLMASPGVGQKTAERLWEKLGPDAVRVLREQPAAAVAAVDLSHFTLERAELAADHLRDEQAMEGCTIDLLDVLHGRGFPKSVAKKAVKKWGNRAAELIRRNPYRLMAFRGVGFLKTDAMYLDLGLPPAKLKRQAYCAWHAVASDTEGHTWYPVSLIEKGIRSKVASAVATPPAALKLAKRGKLLATRRDDRGMLWVADHRKAAAESIVAECVAAASLEGDPDWPDAAACVAEIAGLSDHQADRLAAALTRRISILAGSPGTGKTYTAAAVIKFLVALYGVDSIAVAAPTGKAAVRITEALTGYGLPIRATTIHSLLGVCGSDPEAKEGDSASWGFRHGPNSPLPYRFVIIDEGSMIDTSLFASFLSARAAGTHILIVGDTNQLPPVGHGAPLRDLIRAGVPCGELTEIRRNSGTIVRACASIRDGRPFETAPHIDVEADDPANLYVVRAGKPDEQIERMLAGIRAAQATGLDPVWQVQVLAPVNADSPLARKALNERLQSELNPTGETAGNNPFRVGDKIVCLKNGWLMLDTEFLETVQDCPIVGEVGDMTVYELPNGDRLPVTVDGKVYVANGELAAVKAVAPNLTTAELGSPRRVVMIGRAAKKSEDDGGDQDGGGDGGGKPSTGCQWELGYALTVHKSQGSEWPVVIVMVDEYPGARRVCSREWIYTGISRAKLLCLLVGKKHTADGMCRREALSRRKTFLAESITDELRLCQAAEAVGV